MRPTLFFPPGPNWTPSGTPAAEDRDLNARGVRWDLSDLFESPQDPRLKETEAWVLEESRSFARDFRDRIRVPGGPDPELMAQALSRYEGLLDAAYKGLAYAHLVHAVETQSSEAGALLARNQELITRIHTEVMFFELDWIALEDEWAEPLIADERCARWCHFLRSTRRYRPHTLSEPEEIILAEKQVTGVNAMRRLFDEVTSSLLFEVDVDGETRQLNQSETLALLYQPDRKLRAAAHEGFSRGLEANTHVPAFIINTIVLDHGVNCRLKNYQDPADSRHLANEIDRRSVDALIEACEQHYHLVQEYYRLKGNLLGLDPLYDYDRYAPVEIEGGTLPPCDWASACQIVRQAFNGFSSRLGEIVDEFLEKRWVDAEPRQGKRGGGFCSSTVPSVHPYIMMNFTGKLSDVMTLAHELGHGCHQRLAQPRGILQNSTPLTLAETASVFGEMLAFQRLMRRQADPKVRLALLCHKLEDSFATVFRQIVLTRFEERVHAERPHGELSVARLDEIWMDVSRPMHGEAVRLTEGYRRWWAYVTHFVHSPFYCYAYSFGELLVLALWKQYQREGEDFVPKYLELLTAGGSDSPQNLVAKVGLDLNDTRFWASGLSILGEFVDEAQRLAQEF